MGAECNPAWPDDLIEMGMLAGAYGVRGWVKVYPYAQGSQGGESLLNARRWWLARGAERRAIGVVQSNWRNTRRGGSVIAQLAGCDKRDTAQMLKGFCVYVQRTDFKTLSEGEYYWIDLIGSDVTNAAGVSLGKVVDLIDNGMHTVMRVTYRTFAQPRWQGATTKTVHKYGEEAQRRQRGCAKVLTYSTCNAADTADKVVDGERLIPFVSAYLIDIDISQRRIVVDWEPDW